MSHNKTSIATPSVDASIMPSSLGFPAEGPVPSIPIIPSTMFNCGLDNAYISTTYSANFEGLGAFLWYSVLISPGTTPYMFLTAHVNIVRPWVLILGRLMITSESNTFFEIL